MSEAKSGSNGISFCGLLGIAFIVLKLCKVIDWSWWWVICPLWGPIAIYIIALPFLIIRRAKDERRRIDAGYINNLKGWKDDGRSKWEERLEEMKKAKSKS